MSVKELKSLKNNNKVIFEGKKYKPLKNAYIESYGCQMNFSDSEIITSIMKKKKFKIINKEYKKADIIFINTCSIRNKAEETIKKRLEKFKEIKKKNKKLIIGILGCMAKRLKQKLLKEEKNINLIAGPDSYKELPSLIKKINYGTKSFNIFLSKEETYAEINPTRINSNEVNVFISIMRGCDNICSFCVVPFTRGRERSKDPYLIIKESKRLFKKKYREIILLGQNVDSYK